MSSPSQPSSRTPAQRALPERLHCVGVGGGGLSALARLLAARGHVVSGSDSAATFQAEELRAAGVAVRSGHDARHVGDAQLLIRSAAVPDSNPEVAAALAHDVPVIKYSEALGRVMTGRRGIAVAGTHGKSTTTALVAHLLRSAGLDPAWIVGARPLSLPDSSGWGQGDAMVVEACEYDHSFLQLEYEIAVINGVAPDHLDCFGDARGVVQAFARFAQRLPPGGTLVLGAGVGADCELSCPVGARRWHVEDHLHLDRVTEDAHGYHGTVEGGAWGRGPFELPLLGRHNLENLRTALLAVLALGVPLWFALPHVASFLGVARRLQDLGEHDGVRVIDDFAHHPDALLAASDAVRARFPNRRVVGIFQPHQVSRTADFLPGFASALQSFDAVGLCDIFISRDRHPEQAEGLARDLAKRTGDRLLRLGAAQEADRAVAAMLRPGDVCLIMGAGDIDGLAGRLAGATARPRAG